MPKRATSETKNGSDELLDAIVDYVNERLTGEALTELVHVEVGHALDAAEHITLGEVITEQQVSGVAVKFALEWRIEGAIHELADDIAVRIHSALSQDGPQLGVLAPQLAEKVTSTPAFHRLVDRLYRSPLARRTAGWVLYRVAIDSLNRNRELASDVPGVGTLMKLTEAVGLRIAPSAPEKLGELLREITERVAANLLAGAEGADAAQVWESLARAAREAFEESPGALSVVGETITAEAIEDFLVVGFAFWNDLRGTRPIRTAIEEGVAVFFDKYAEHTLAELLDEIGVTREDMIEEALRFMPRATRAVQANGMLESFLRRQFRDFVDSERVKHVLR